MLLPVDLLSHCRYLEEALRLELDSVVATGVALASEPLAESWQVSVFE